VRVWTFVIRGGAVIGIQVPGSPPLAHPGHSTTVWKMVGDQDQADAVQSVLDAHGCHTERYCDEQTPEQEAERLRRLGLGES
jgi:hypothetical protein